MSVGFKKILLISLLLVPSLVWATASVSLGGLANDAMGPVVVLRYLFNAASIVVGIFFLMAAWNRYLRHRRNPQESPLSTVIVFVILGVALVTMPFLYQLSQQASIHSGARDATW